MSLPNNQEKISRVVDRYWGFDDHQRHIHSWHEKQDCLEIIQKMEADLESSLSKLTEENATLRAENERLREELERLTFRLAEVEDIPATCPICGQTGNHIHAGELP